jgi:hypothetical protein
MLHIQQIKTAATLIQLISNLKRMQLVKIEISRAQLNWQTNLSIIESLPQKAKRETRGEKKFYCFKAVEGKVANKHLEKSERENLIWHDVRLQ